MLTNLIKATVATALLPVSAAIDVLTFPKIANDDREAKPEKE